MNEKKKMEKKKSRLTFAQTAFNVFSCTSVFSFDSPLNICCVERRRSTEYVHIASLHAASTPKPLPSIASRLRGSFVRSFVGRFFSCLLGR